MATFLIRDFDDPRGYKELVAANGELPRSKGRGMSIGVRKSASASVGYVPWGVTGDGKVVYAKYGEHVGWRGGSGAHRLRQYNGQVSQQRRRLCQSELGALALKCPRFSKSAVLEVSTGIRKYLEYLQRTDSVGAANSMKKSIGHYFFTGNNSEPEKTGYGFGRISQTDKGTMSSGVVWRRILRTLEQGRLEQVLAIHDAIGRKMLNQETGGRQWKVYDCWGTRLRQDWFNDPRKRGRIDAPTRAEPTRTAGIAGSDAGVGNVTQARTRGADSYRRDSGREGHAQADDYYDDLDARNLLFGAAISGTTGSLLQAALAFGHLAEGEARKQYAFAIVGYLVGGGMHSYHEVMAVAAKASIPYNPGSYRESLPTAFLQSNEFRTWHAKYYDIVTLGALHWRHNQGARPSAHVRASRS